MKVLITVQKYLEERECKKNKKCGKLGIFCGVQFDQDIGKKYTIYKITNFLLSVRTGEGGVY